MSDADHTSAKLPIVPAQGASELGTKRLLRRKAGAAAASGTTAPALANQPSIAAMAVSESPVAVNKVAASLPVEKMTEVSPKFKPTAPAKPRKLAMSEKAPPAPALESPVLESKVSVAKPVVAKPAVAEPVVTEPVAAEPVVAATVPAEPAVAEPAMVKAKPVEPVTVEAPPAEPFVIEPIVVVEPVVASAEPVSTMTPPPVEEPAADILPTVFSRPFSIKDMTMDMSANFSGMQDAMTEAQAKAKAAFEKSTSVLGEVGTFTKGNVEAIVESGKIYASGLQEMGTKLAAEGRTAFETITADAKDLAAAKSPTDFFKLQSDLVRKNFDSAVAYSSKNSELFLKLMSDAMAPISGRVSLAVEKVRQTAPTISQTTI